MKLRILLVLFFAVIFSVNSQCDVNRKYDKIVSGYHSSMALSDNGEYLVWGQEMASNGTSNVAPPISLTTSNFSNLSGSVIFTSMGGTGSGGADQYVALATSGLYAWGEIGAVLNTSLKSTASFSIINTPTGGDATTKLPIGVTPSQVTMLHVFDEGLAIVANGNVWMLVNGYANLQGNNTSVASTTWHKVKINATTDLTGVIAVRGQSSNSQDAGRSAMMALTDDGQVYTWGSSTYIGNGSNVVAKNYATQMTLPSEFSATNKPKMIGVTGGSKGLASVKNTLYVLSYSGSLYALGDNSLKQCGDFSTTERVSWVNVKRNNSTNFDNVNFISVQEHTAGFPAVAVITTSGDLYTWGDNDGYMIGRATETSFDPGIPNGFTVGSDKAIFTEVGGHTLVYVKEGSIQFCYVGHRVSGSMGESTTSSGDVTSFDCTNTPQINLCGAVPVSADATKSTIGVNNLTIEADGNSTSTITITLFDNTNTQLTTTGGNVVVNTTAGTLGNVVDNNDGTYTVVLTSTNTAATASITFSINGTTASATTSVAFVVPDSLNITSTPISAFTSCVGSNSAEQTFTVSGSALTNNVVITAPTNWEVSTTSGFGFTGSVTLTPSTGNVPETTIYLRTISTAASGNISGTINITSTGATTQTFNVAGTVGLYSQPLSVSNSLCEANGLEWVIFNNITASTGTGTLFGTVTAAVTHSNAGMQASGMFVQETFPTEYNVPTTNVIRNDFAGTFTISFSEPISNPQVAFSSIGNSSTPVGINTSLPYQVIWNGQAMTYSSSTSMTGQEGFTIVSFPGTHSSLTFNYLNNEAYVTMAFGAQNPNCNNITICEGESITLTASGGTTYAWSPALGLNTTSGAQVVASPTQTTTYSVIDTANACAQPTEVTITVNAAPTAPTVANSGTQLSCIGDTIADLQATVSNGDTIEWFAAATGGTVLASSTVLVAGNTYYAQATNANGCSSTRTALTVIANNSLYFDGVNDYVSLTSPTIPDGASAFTIEAWIKPDGSNYDTNFHAIFGNQVGATANTRNPSIYFKDAKIYLDTYEDGTITRFEYFPPSSQPIVFTENNWSHIAIVKDGNQYIIYVNGGVWATTPAPNNVNITGSYQFGKIDNYFVGQMDEVRFWGDARTQTEIQNNMNASLVGNETDLLGYYTFNQGIANGTNTGIITLTDQTSNANTGTVNNMALTGTSSNFVPGYFPQITGANEVNIGETITLAHNDQNGTWSVNDTNIATIASTGVVSGIAEGTVTITYTSCSNNATKQITVINPNTVPTITAISNQRSCPNTDIDVTTTITDAETSADNLTVTASSSNQSIVVDSNIVITNTANDFTFTVSPVADTQGTATITITVEYEYGATVTTSFDVTFEDTVTPTVLTKNITVELDANGQASITAADIDNGSTDNCGIATMSLDITDFDCLNIGSNPVTLTVTDVNGNTDSATAMVTVEDNIAPTVITQNITVQLDTNGQATITPEMINNGSTDNCAIATMSLDITSFDCSHVGANTVTLTVTDVNGNSDTNTAIITVEDTTVPTVITQNITVQLDANGQASITADDIDNGSTDNCAIESLTLDTTSFTCNDVGNNTVTLTVKDVNGNEANATATVTVEDTVTPTVLTKNITVELDANGQASITAADIDNGSTDNCGIDTMTLDVISFDCSNISSSINVLRAADNNGNYYDINTDTGYATIIGSINGNCQSGANAIAFDASSNRAFAQSPNGCFEFFEFNPETGALITSYNSADVPAALEFVDGVLYGSGILSASLLTINIDTGVMTPIGQHNSTESLWMNGMAYDSATSTMYGVRGGGGSTELYTIDLATGTASLVGACNVSLASLNIGSNGKLYAGGGQMPDRGNIYELNKTNGSATLIGSTQIPGPIVVNAMMTYSTIGSSNPVTLTVTDVNGNTDSATAMVTVEDNIAPTVITQNITVQLDTNGQATITPEMINNGSTDNCAIATMSLDITSFDCSHVGANTVTLTVTDVNGNSDTNTAIVTVEDTTVPTVITQNITVQLDANGQASITADDIDNVSTDNCAIESLTLDITSFTCNDVGNNTVTLSVTDIYGNTATETATVTVTDTTLPTITAPTAVTATTNTGCTATGIALGTPVTADNCTVANVSNDAPNAFPLGTTTVTWTVTDGTGNSTTAIQLVTVTDTELPTITAPIAVTVSANASCSAFGVVLGTATVNDNCSVQSVSNNAPELFPLGVTTVTWTVVDGAGNTATATQIVTVEDTTSPTIIAPAAMTVNGNSICEAVITNLGTAITSDNCSIVTVTNDAPVAFSIGTTTVTWTATDNAGNMATATQTVTVIDNTVPSITGMPSNIYSGNDTGSCNAIGTWVTPTASDNCSTVTLSSTHNSGDVFALGTTTVTYTATDEAGNTSSSSFTVSVTDTELPTITAPIAVTVSANASCNAFGVVLGTAIVNDNCSVQSVSNNAPAVFPLGTTSVIWTVVDAAGNTATATQTVTVTDTTNPTIVAPASIVVNANTGSTAVGVDLGNPVINDNCSAVAVTNNAPLAFPLGTTTVTWTVTDASGNTATATQLVTVKDILAPTVITKDITVYLDALGLVSITTSDVDNGSFDNVAISTMSVSPSSFSCTDVGVNTVTLTVTDNAGNIGTHTAIVTVVDAIAPTVITKNLTLTLDAYGNASITSDMLDNGSFDTCGIASISANVLNFTCNDLGSNTVLLTVTDTNGNVASGSAIVTVISSDSDNDGDGIKDNCDDDDDNDGILDMDDNCSFTYNPNQADNDDDGLGDVCDADDDNDGVEDTQDNCPIAYNPYQEDRDRDGKGDVCDLQEINISNAFSPNGDGINDTWMIYNIENHPNNTVRVFNRWGDEVFFAKGYKNTWNGHYKNRSIALPDGASYYYQIDLDGNGSFKADGWLYISNK